MIMKDNRGTGLLELLIVVVIIAGIGSYMFPLMIKKYKQSQALIQQINIYNENIESVMYETENYNELLDANLEELGVTDESLDDIKTYAESQVTQMQELEDLY